MVWLIRQFFVVDKLKTEVKNMKIKYRHVSDPSVFKEFDTHIEFATMPNIFKENKAQLEYDEFMLNKLEKDKKRGIILEYCIVNDK